MAKTILNKGQVVLVKKNTSKPANKRIIVKLPVVAQTTSTSIVSANTAVAKSYEEKRMDEIRPYVEIAVNISSNFETMTKRIVAFETHTLYKYLGETFELYKKIQADKHKRDYFYDNLRSHLKENGIKTNKNTNDVSLLIRLIFKVKPKTAHLYSRAIQAAYEAKVKPTAFIEYVDREGGLEKLRMSQVEKERAVLYRSSLKKAKELAWRYLKAMESNPLVVTEIPRRKVIVTPNHFVVLVGIGFGQPRNPNKNAEIRILSCLPENKVTEEFVIASIAKNFASNLIQAEKYISELEGK